ncbi:thiol reductant ABC exporter subunit CydD [Roseibium sp.]|uniref:thiol reductant ABC exporter subunit CydD n=1 Tax=Roseibium sp. TaxID=1936156 RepID=UPI003B52BCA0
MKRRNTKRTAASGAEYRPGEGAQAPIGVPGPDEASQLRRAGRLLAIADLFWIPQAALIAYAAASMLEPFLLSSKPLDSTGALMPVFAAAVGVVMLALLRVGLQSFAMNMARRAARTVQSVARTSLLAAAAKVSPSALFPSSGAFAAHLTEQVDLLGPYYRNYLPQMMRVKIVPLVIVLAVLPISWIASIILLICGPLIPLFMALIGIRAKKASADQQDELTRLSGTLLDRIRGLETLTLFGALDRTQENVRQAGDSFRRGTMNVLKIAFLSSTVLELFSALGIAFAAVYIGFSLLGDISFGTWGVPLTYWGGLFVLLLAPEFFAPLRGFAAAYHDRAAGLAAQEKLTALTRDLPQPERQVSEGASATQDGGLSAPPAIHFDGVSISYGERPIYEDFDLQIASGQTVLLFGPSGSGKTTLIDGILGFHSPNSGAVRINGQNLDPDFAHQLRQNTMWLGQAPKLFHGSLKANLLRGANPENKVSDDNLWAALQLAGAETLVRGLPRGLATPLGEDGFGLSVGEIRRIALARAAVRKSAALLLADEPTAGLDDETAADVISGLKKLCEGRTAVIATHNPAVLALPGQKIDLARYAGAKVMEAIV